MQVFAPLPDVLDSLQTLDKRRLAKQRVEAKQLIDTILDRPMVTQTGELKSRTGWRNHPAAVMFRQYLPYLIYYYNLSLAVHEQRGGKNDKLGLEPLLLDTPGVVNQPHMIRSLNDMETPHWWGDDEIHSTHRSRLLLKGKMDVLADRIVKHIGARGANAWLKFHGFPSINECRNPEWREITELLDDMGAEQSTMPNHYHQFGWLESDDMEYLWPGEYPGEPNKLLR